MHTCEIEVGAFVFQGPALEVCTHQRPCRRQSVFYFPVMLPRVTATAGHTQKQNKNRALQTRPHALTHTTHVSRGRELELLRPRRGSEPKETKRHGAGVTSTPPYPPSSALVASPAVRGSRGTKKGRGTVRRYPPPLRKKHQKIITRPTLRNPPPVRIRF